MNLPGKPFSDVLGELQHGELLHELTLATYKIVERVMETRKPGKIKISLDFSPTGKGTVNVAANFTVKEPEHDRETTTFFVGKDYSLQRNDPAQPKLPLREVERPDNQPVKVHGNT